MKNLETAILANGCFWCSEAVFQRIIGLEKIESGYTGGHVKNPSYREVCEGTTGHAEAIRFTYDPEKISFRELLMIFFTTHDPTTLNRQGNDVGTQYRSAIFYLNEEQKKIAEEVIQELNKTTFNGNIVTEIKKASEFYVAEEEHHNFYNQNKNFPYCQAVIDPKLQKLRQEFAGKLQS
ncbi:MAG TPA: peptide-methionine (S)-S-oxide reductase MsrA [Flavobacteriaceae bacterium]|nr:peptide-methionine (S)-S-oxide reductase MsrA [Flavobacteriaceae bacterium]